MIMNKKYSKVLLVTGFIVSVSLLVSQLPIQVGTASLFPAEEAQFIQLVDKALPAVVSVIGSRTDANGQQVPFARGSGFLVRANGLVVTNKHVVIDEALSYTAIFSDGRKYKATVVARDPINDLALLKIDGANLPVLPLASAESIKIGQTAIAVGNSLGRYPNTVTKGIVSGVGRALTATSSGGKSETLDAVIQTDAAINSGNSGGPLINSRGEVVGVNTAVEREGWGIAFAIPVNEVVFVINSYEKNGSIVRPYLGVRYLNIDRELQEILRLPYHYGALVDSGNSSGSAVAIQGPADKAGIKDGDIILSVNGELLLGSKSLRSVLQQYSPGDVVTLTRARGGEVKDIKVSLTKAP